MSGVGYTSVVSAADLAALQSRMENVEANAISFVGAGPMTIASLFANYPASSSLVGRYARVTDLWGSVRSVMVCEADTSGFYWRPQRTDYAPAPVAMTSGTMSLVPLVTAPVINLTGTLSGTVTVTPQTTNVWPGATFTVTSNSVLGVFGIVIAGLAGGGTVPLLSGGIRTITYFSGTGWKAS